jgi:hypothetical protein
MASSHGSGDAGEAHTSGSIKSEQSKVNWKFLRSISVLLRFEFSPGGLPEDPIWCCWRAGFCKVGLLVTGAWIDRGGRRGRGWQSRRDVIVT